MKLISFAIPCYNSEAYLQKCLESILPGGDEIEILIIDDGSTDRTAEIADAYEQQYPSICRAIHKPNGGHGDAVNTGLKNADGLYFKVVDSDDWLDSEAYMKVLAKLRELACGKTALDMLITNYVYEKKGYRHKKSMRQPNFPKNRLFTWNDIRHIYKGQYMLMHSVIYRTGLLMECALELPKHTFYVDNIFVYKPLPKVRTMYYMDVGLYRYFIGREDQSVNEKVMISRIDNQLRINRIMADVDIFQSPEPKCHRYMLNFLEIVTTVTSVLLIKKGTKESLQQMYDMWEYIKEHNEKAFSRLKGGIGYSVMNLFGKPGREIALISYAIMQKIFGFN